MTTKVKVAIVIGSLIGSFAVGRFTTPVKTVVETKIVEVEKKSVEKKTDADTKKHKETTVTETVKPDGSKEVVTKTTEDTDTSKTTDTKKTIDTIITKDETKTSVKSGGGFTVSALVGTNVTSIQSYVYGLQAGKQVLGPISVGLWGLSNGNIGISAGLQF